MGDEAARLSLDNGVVVNLAWVVVAVPLVAFVDLGRVLDLGGDIDVAGHFEGSATSCILTIEKGRI